METLLRKLQIMDKISVSVSYYQTQLPFINVAVCFRVIDLGEYCSEYIRYYAESVMLIADKDNINANLESINNYVLPYPMLLFKPIPIHGRYSMKPFYIKMEEISIPKFRDGPCIFGDTPWEKCYWSLIENLNPSNTKTISYENSICCGLYYHSRIGDFKIRLLMLWLNILELNYLDFIPSQLSRTEQFDYQSKNFEAAYIAKELKLKYSIPLVKNFKPSFK